MADRAVHAALALALDGSRGPGVYQSKADAQIAKMVAKRAKVLESEALTAVAEARRTVAEANRIANDRRDGKYKSEAAAMKALRAAAPGLGEDDYDALYAAATRWSAW